MRGRHRGEDDGGKNRMNDEKVETGAGGERESAREREKSTSTREEEETEVKHKQRDYADRKSGENREN